MKGSAVRIRSAALGRVRRGPDDAHVPRISEFYGIVVAMYYREHGVAHFHADVRRRDRRHRQEGISPRALRLVQEWFELHRDELRLNWARARDNAPLVRIDPLP